MTRARGKPKTPVVATCGCGEVVRGGSIDRVNELLARHYPTCPGPKKTGRARTRV